jgi:hypothetical protein
MCYFTIRDRKIVGDNPSSYVGPVSATLPDLCAKLCDYVLIVHKVKIVTF